MNTSKQTTSKANNNKGQKKQEKFVPQKELDELNNAVKGVKTKLGTTVTGISPHAINRGNQRKVEVDTIKKTLAEPDKTYPGNKKGRTCYLKEHYKVVLSDDGNIITAIDLDRED